MSNISSTIITIIPSQGLSCFVLCFFFPLPQLLRVEMKGAGGLKVDLCHSEQGHIWGRWRKIMLCDFFAALSPPLPGDDGTLQGTQYQPFQKD